LKGFEGLTLKNKSISISDESVKGIKAELHVVVLQIKKELFYEICRMSVLKSNTDESPLGMG
jgi:hypothetical protein